MASVEILPSKKKNSWLFWRKVWQNSTCQELLITDNLLDSRSSRTRVLNDKRRNIAFKKEKFDAKCDKIQPSDVKLLTTS